MTTVCGQVNIGNPDEISIADFAHKIKSMVPGTTSRIVHGPASKDDPHRRKPDISRAKEVLGWEPRVAVDDVRVCIVRRAMCGER